MTVRKYVEVPGVMGIYQTVAGELMAGAEGQNLQSSGVGLLAAKLGLSELGVNDLGTINAAMSKLDETDHRQEFTSAVEIGRQVLSIIENFAFIRPVHPMGAFSARNLPPNSRGVITASLFDAWVANHQFDDYPFLYGITRPEGHQLRGEVNGRSHQEVYWNLCKDLGIVWDFEDSKSYKQKLLQVADLL